MTHLVVSGSENNKPEFSTGVMGILHNGDSI
ncbi:hypothetical protein OURE66S_00226 [Oligella ureolytica]